MGRRRDDGENEALDVGMTEEERVDLFTAAVEFARQTVLDGTAGGLSEEALRLAFVMATPLTGSSPREWARLAGCGHMTYYRNHDRPEFAAVLDSIRQRKRARLETLADRRLERILESGDDKSAIAAIRTIKEEAGRFVRRVETTQVTETPAEREQRRAMQQRAQQHQDGKPLH